MGELAPHEMRRAWMTALGNAKLARRERVEVSDLPDARGKRGMIGSCSSASRRVARKAKRAGQLELPGAFQPARLATGWQRQV